MFALPVYRYTGPSTARAGISYAKLANRPPAVARRGDPRNPLEAKLARTAQLHRAQAPQRASSQNLVFGTANLEPNSMNFGHHILDVWVKYVWLL